MGKFWNRGSKQDKEEEKSYDLQGGEEFEAAYNDQSYSQQQSESNIEYTSDHSGSESSSRSRSRSGSSDEYSSSSEQYDEEEDDDYDDDGTQGQSSPKDRTSKNNKNSKEKIEDEGQEDAINSTKKKKGSIFGRISLFGGRKNKQKKKDNKKDNKSNDSSFSESDIEIDDDEDDDNDDDDDEEEEEEESYAIDVMDDDDEESSVSEKEEEEEDDTSLFLEPVEKMEEVEDESSFREEYRSSFRKEDGSSFREKDETVETSSYYNNALLLQIPQLQTPPPTPPPIPPPTLPPQQIDTRDTATKKIRYIPSQPSQSKSKKKTKPKPKTKTKTKNMTRNSTGTGTHHPDPLLDTEVNELTNEVSRLRTLVKLMMDRMDLYETQSEYLVDANQDHDIEWKKKMIENYGPSSTTKKKKQSSDSNTIIKNLLDEQLMSNQWIQRLEGVQRGYQQRVLVTQNQLKTLRFEQIQTNRQIVEVKRASSAKKKQPPPPAKPQSALLLMSGNDRGRLKVLERRASTGDIINNNGTVSQLRMKKPAQKHRTSSMVEEMISTWQEEGKHIQPVMTSGEYNQTKEDQQAEKANTKKKKKEKETKTRSKSKSKSKNAKSSKKKHNRDN